MSFWQKLFNADHQYNEHKNQTSCVENDCSCKTNEQLLDALVKATDEDVIKGIKKVLISRGYSRKELLALIKPPIQ
ncbi:MULTISPECIES: hypothetical protein [Acinetobacter]|uniref:Regulatory protein RecX n=1 Tax=Acinetobacter thutiue TaxID=2998078 RepID=A0ABT7WKZ0_9GAMM|nr:MULTISPECIES: hypothetical protein [Acinetobacter]MCY6411242.1 hypothetical protein [Acinetobacter thutiue]MDH0031383.1 hypothetical protein [Acinetobacter sp. GD04021]MDH0887132.1 hypothetical protein [Acinetobacter sp. GD03873]MDH1083579.1 hypothetical protein [Acinetobacter sp. GD03983]MDH2190448.1 hypothetical protein [Acinetobacter sp. GD03645]